MDFPDRRTVKHMKSKLASQRGICLNVKYLRYIRQLHGYSRNYLAFGKNGKGSTGLPFWRISKYRIGDC